MSENDKAGQEREVNLSKAAVVSFFLGLFMLLLCLPFILIATLTLNPLILPELIAKGFVILPQTLGIILAVIALRKIKKSGGLLTGKGLAITGLTLSILAYPLAVLYFAGQVKVYCKSKVIRVDDAAKGVTVQLSDKDRRELIEGIEILVTGDIDGSATVDTFREMPVSRKEGDPISDVSRETQPPDFSYLIEGEVRLEIQEDWYDDECFLKYEPVSVRSGSLTIRYYLHASPYVPQKDSPEQKNN